MRKLNGALVVGTLCAVLAGNAFAADATFETKFTYSKSASMAENYSNFERTAKEACETEVDNIGRQALSTKSRLELNCQNELLTKVVTATRNEILIAYHKQKMATAQG